MYTPHPPCTDGSPKLKNLLDFCTALGMHARRLCHLRAVDRGVETPACKDSTIKLFNGMQSIGEKVGS